LLFLLIIIVPFSDIKSLCTYVQWHNGSYIIKYGDMTQSDDEVFDNASNRETSTSTSMELSKIDKEEKSSMSSMKESLLSEGNSSNKNKLSFKTLVNAIRFTQHKRVKEEENLFDSDDIDYIFSEALPQKEKTAAEITLLHNRLNTIEDKLENVISLLEHLTSSSKK
jgi:hypothetical protein